MEMAIRQIMENKIIVIVRGVFGEKLIALAEAMYEGGIRLIECTYDASQTVSDREIAENIAQLSRCFQRRMLVGAGTVLTEHQVELTKAAGGAFIISPDANPKVIRRTKELGMISIPGAITPTEIAMASREGADFVKVFPVNLYGPSYIKTLRAPLSHVRMLAVNGISEDNMWDYLEAGACGVGVGSGIVNKRMIENNDFVGIAALARKYTEKINRRNEQ